MLLQYESCLDEARNSGIKVRIFDRIALTWFTGTEFLRVQLFVTTKRLLQEREREMVRKPEQLIKDSVDVSQRPTDPTGQGCWTITNNPTISEMVNMSTSLKRSQFSNCCLLMPPFSRWWWWELIIIIVVIAQIVACHLSVISRHGFHVGHTKCGKSAQAAESDHHQDHQEQL